MSFMNHEADSAHIVLTIPETTDATCLLGVGDEHLRYIQSRFNAKIAVRGNEIALDGDPIELQLLTSFFTHFFDVCSKGSETSILSHADIARAIDLLYEPDLSPTALRDDVLLTYRGKSIRPKTAGQKYYVDAIRNHTITFAIGPAGTGKTYLAMAMAVAALKQKSVGRIILTRPIVEAGENLGFLPGTLTEKVDPYIRPLYDALFDMMDSEKAIALIDQNVIEIAPLAFMRGRTLNNSFIILDEAQNTTPEQMKMFLTRLGFGSKMVITGDITQTDLPKGISGLVSARPVLEGIDDIAFADFSGKDVVRHSLVQTIVAAYEKATQ